ncbi:MAG: helix-turn-helix transcriptional regulator [Eubacteriales bacterium]|nr:helix-turn-helix transcriptional regulator [Eubacteriales bacterium]
MDYKYMGERIRTRRRELSMTQEALAEHVDISISFVGHIERASRKPSLETVVNICECLNMALDDVIPISKRRQRDGECTSEQLEKVKKLFEWALEMCK